MVNAGVDMTMEPTTGRDFIATLKAAVNNGDVSMDRIDDAVRRILQIKERAGVFAEPLADRALVNSGASAARPTGTWHARRCASRWCCSRTTACSRSPKTSRVFVAGKNADNMGHQCGGWTISWQGGSGDTTPGTTILEGIRARSSAAAGR
jgi:beta-glucosidase